MSREISRIQGLSTFLGKKCISFFFFNDSDTKARKREVEHLPLWRSGSGVKLQLILTVLKSEERKMKSIMMTTVRLEPVLNQFWTTLVHLQKSTAVYKTLHLLNEYCRNTTELNRTKVFRDLYILVSTHLHVHHHWSDSKGKLTHWVRELKALYELELLVAGAFPSSVAFS